LFNGKLHPDATSPGRIRTCDPRFRKPDTQNSKYCSDKDLQQFEKELGVLLGVLESDHPELTTIITAWPHLPEHIRQAIVTLVEAVTQGDSANE